MIKKIWNSILAFWHRLVRKSVEKAFLEPAYKKQWLTISYRRQQLIGCLHSNWRVIKRIGSSGKGKQFRIKYKLEFNG